MPRKIRQLKHDLRKAGLVEIKDRGKGSHDVWALPEYPEIKVVLSGHDGDDAKPYMERNVRDAIAKARQTREA